MKIQYYNRKPVSPEPDFPVKYCQSLDELLETSDFVSLHLPLNQNTKGKFGREQFNKMKDGSVLINTARGGVLDQDALIEALESGKVCQGGSRRDHELIHSALLCRSRCLRGRVSIFAFLSLIQGLRSPNDFETTIRLLSFPMSALMLMSRVTTWRCSV